MTLTPPAAAVRFPLRLLVIVVCIALFGRALLIASNTVSFHGDEAVVALMARHILEGQRPTFFYGQAYMGSLDAWLIAVGFALFGQSVTTIRLVQGALYLGIVASGFAAAWKVTRSAPAAAAAGLILAVPSVLFVTYTTATLGGYNETLLLGSLVLILAFDLDGARARSPLRWAALGVCAGVGWWTNALIAIYGLPAAVLILYRAAHGRITLPVLMRGIGIALVGFLVGGAPWWAFALETNFAPLAFLTGSGSGSGFAGTDVFSLPLSERLLGFFLLGIPTVFGLRFPWFPAYFLPAVGLFAAAVVGIALFRFFFGAARRSIPADSRLVIGVLIVGFSVVYLASRFSFDPTGRYFLPLVLPFAVVVGAWVGQSWESATVPRRILAAAILALVIGYQAAGQISTALTYPGFTTQFNLDTHIPNDQDAALIAFIDAQGLRRGYTQYWISFRLAFLTGERMQYSASLPYLPNLRYTPLDERYAPYRAAADAAYDAGEPLAFIIAQTTPNVTPIRAWLEGQFAAAGITYSRADLGMYAVYYGFSAPPPRPPFTDGTGAS
ncbi:MAG: glycosyltransferase family 39 protein [bacterium]|nr:glycosyltransferase family 39 protein [bacterium]